MSEKNDEPKVTRKRDRSLQGVIRLAGFKKDDQRPEMAVYALDKRGKALYTAAAGEDGGFSLPSDAAQKAAQVAIGPLTENFDTLDRSLLSLYSMAEFEERLKLSPVLDIAGKYWKQWWLEVYCVGGSVKHCYPYPWFISELYQKFAAVELLQPISQVSLSKKSLAVSELSLAKHAFQPFPFKQCDVVCDGIVEVYRRTCCCTPVIVDYPKIPNLIDILEKLVETVPIPWPPIPEPDPPPYLETFFKGGALDDMTLNAPQDLLALRSLSMEQQAAYIQARPYLAWYFCSCGAAKKVAEGPIQPNGNFNICWLESVRLMVFNCYDQYAYKVKQNINGVVTTIYDGVAANKWFGYADDAELVSYHPKAQGCRHNDFPGEGAFALLQDIGLTESYHLNTPNATGWDRVAVTSYNDGLAFPAPNPAAALGAFLDRNWGGTLALRYHFSEEMRNAPAGAKYYRISVTASDGSGNPVGPRTYLSAGLSWKKYVGINVDTQSLGPSTVGSESNLFMIPYDADADWHSGQYHGYLDTTEFANGRHLVTLEVFDAAGAQIKPSGAAGPGAGRAFTFRRWFQPVGPTANVPFAALTHMFWWDNRKAHAEIIDLRMNGSESSAQCQFLEGPGSSTFSVGYKAYHDQPMFLLNHSLWWRRGLGGPSAYLVNTSPYNVGPALGVSPSHTFGFMLGAFPPSFSAVKKCTFTLNLYVNVKTTNGFGTLDGLDGWDYGSFALEIP
jgi:hypothetical protein